MSFTTEIEDFIPEQTFDCGQCFRWKRADDGAYVGIAGGQCVSISANGTSVTIDGCSEADYEKFWRRYLDADRDYGGIKKLLSVNDTMNRAIEYGGGIRILRQEFFETLLSYIISQRSSIPRIKTCVTRLCEKCGDRMEFHGETVYAFPRVEQLVDFTEKDFAGLGVGYRAEYLVKAVQMVADGEINEAELEKDDTETARKKLLKIKGVGDKVCDCVLLFALGKYDLFPSDVWIKRVMSENFGEKDAKSAGEKLFGAYSGFAQQYLFYWKRENKWE